MFWLDKSLPISPDSRNSVKSYWWDDRHIKGVLEEKKIMINGANSDILPEFLSYMQKVRIQNFC